jgi:hypothetical protein
LMNSFYNKLLFSFIIFISFSWNNDSSWQLKLLNYLVSCSTIGLQTFDLEILCHPIYDLPLLFR